MELMCLKAGGCERFFNINYLIYLNSFVPSAIIVWKSDAFSKSSYNLMLGHVAPIW